MSDEKFMRMAIDEAKKALEDDEGMAFGAVIVKDGELVSSSHNTVFKTKNPTNHAEMNAIRAACDKLNTMDLSGCTLYSTCEPCPMCFAASWWANISNLVFGVSLEDVTNVSNEMLVSSEYLNNKGNSKVNIRGGFLREECMKLYSK